MRSSSFLTVLALMTCATPAFAADLLTPADVEKASGIKGVHSVPKDPMSGAGGELNFADADNKLVAIVMIQPLSMYDFWKTRYGKKGEPVSGIGTEGFRTKPKASISYIVFKKGNTGVWIQSMGWKKSGAANLSDAQLTELAQLAASRL